MGKLNNYDSIEEKIKKFSYKKIKTANEFNNWYKSEKNNFLGDHFIYRGVNEAKYKLYTSSQRLWWTIDFVRYPDKIESMNKWDEYSDFLNLLLINARKWNDKLLERYYKKLNIKLNDFALLSLMQHYDLPTPLLDFTTDQDIALYFAFSNMIQKPKEPEIDNYVSLYIINLNKNRDRLSNLYDVYKEHNNLNFKTLYDFRKMFFFSEFNETDTSLQDFKLKTYTHSNLNILNQKGAFLFNHHPWLPLDMSNEPLSHYPRLKEIMCIDIHKSIKEFVLLKLKEKKAYINKDYLFPSYNDFKEKTLTKTLQEFTL